MQFNAIVQSCYKKDIPCDLLANQIFQSISNILHQMIYMLIADGHIMAVHRIWPSSIFHRTYMFDIDAMRINLYKKFISPKKGEIWCNGKTYRDENAAISSEGGVGIINYPRVTKGNFNSPQVAKPQVVGIEIDLSDKWRIHHPYPSSWRDFHCLMGSGNFNYEGLGNNPF